MNKKGSFELGVGFLVKIILGLVILGMGIMLFFTLYNKANDYRTAVDDQTRQRLQAIMDKGEPVVVYDASIDTDKKNAAVFDLGVNNVISGGTSKFTLTVKPNPDPSPNFVIKVIDSEVTLNQNEKHYWAIVIEPIRSAAFPEKQYVFIADVLCSDNPNCPTEYGKKALYVNVN
jgi:hypothetical protein